MLLNFFRCFSNCRRKNNPSARLRLETFCNGACNYSVRHTWTLFEITAWVDGKAVTKRANYLLENILTTPENNNLVVKENTFLFGQEYRISLEIETNSLNSTVALYDFATNDHPSNGTCIVDPPSGEVLATHFVFTCYGWLDSDMPLLFKVYYKIEEELFTLASFGGQHSHFISLPQGNAAENFTVTTKVNIVDSLGAVNSVYLNVQVC